jgi:large subunit ribosomal protein L29
MNANELRKLESKDIEGRIVDLKRQLFDLRFEQATGQLTNTALIGKLKKDIARMYTVLNERRG